MTIIFCFLYSKLDFLEEMPRQISGIKCLLGINTYEEKRKEPGLGKKIAMQNQQNSCQPGRELKSEGCLMCLELVQTISGYKLHLTLAGRVAMEYEIPTDLDLEASS